MANITPVSHLQCSIGFWKTGVGGGAVAEPPSPPCFSPAKICRVIPIHTTNVERTFSQVKLIKTSIRNRMAEKTIDSLLHIVTEGPCIEEFSDIGRSYTLGKEKEQETISIVFIHVVYYLCISIESYNYI